MLGRCLRIAPLGGVLVRLKSGSQRPESNPFLSNWFDEGLTLVDVRIS